MREIRKIRRRLKQHPKFPPHAVTAKNKTYKYGMFLNYDFFGSHGLLPILHNKFGKPLSFFPVPEERAQTCKPELPSTNLYICLC
jgi:hypothetical protein